MLNTIKTKLEKLQSSNTYRYLQKDRQERKDFCSNDYLSLSKDSHFLKMLYESLNREMPPSGSSASRLIMGNHYWHFRLENRLKEWLSSEDVLIFSSAYAANRGLLSSLATDAVIFSDALNHASIIDGVQSSQAPYFIFQHNDVEHLESLLKKNFSSSRTSFPIIVTESLFSMDGDMAPLKDLSRLAQKWNGFLIVDEAHSTGIYGEKGEGLSRELRKENPFIISVHAWGKAMGSYGACVACPQLIKEYLVNFCRDFIFTTALPPSILFQWDCTLNYLLEGERILFLSKKLRENIEFFRKNLASLTLLGDFSSPIVPILFSHRDELLFVSEKLKGLGFAIAPIRFPSVASHKERIRITIHADHKESDLNFLSQTILDLCRTK